jgi:hypothetical protein
MMTFMLWALQYARLYALCFAVWATFDPAASKARDAEALASAIAWAGITDANPVYKDAEHEAAVAARYAVEESWLNLKAIGDSGAAHGAFQLHSSAGRGDAAAQVAGWLALLHEGALRCPASPAAPLSGGCRRAYKLANRRVAAAFAVLDSLRDAAPDASAPLAERAP